MASRLSVLRNGTVTGSLFSKPAHLTPIITTARLTFSSSQVGRFSSPVSIMGVSASVGMICGRYTNLDTETTATVRGNREQLKPMKTGVYLLLFPTYSGK